jgi:Rieske 2Fe-2S family protein
MATTHKTDIAPKQANDLAGPRSAIERASHAPGYVYSSPEVYALEQERFFLRDWLYMGRAEEVANPGDYLTHQIVGEPIVIARDKTGKLNAFYNMCAHRGVEVAFGRGNTRSFKCPYHGWVFDHTGQLTGAAYMKEAIDFNIADCRLKPVRIGVWQGNIFVTLNPDAPSLEVFIAEFENDFAFLRMKDCRLGNRIVIDLDCNWKFVSENLMDFYHVGTLHAKTFGAKFTWTDDNVKLKEKSGLTIWYDAAPPTPGGEPHLGKMPWLEDRPYSFACTGFLAPNLTMFGRIDCIRPMVVWPLGVDKCQVIVYHLFPEEVFARPDIEEKLKIYHDYQITVLEEDRMMIDSLQKAMSTRAFEPGRMSTLETPIHNYINGYLDRIFGKSAGREGAAD